MGWCSGTEVFDGVVKALLSKNPDKRQVISKLIDTLEDMDWDCQSDSEYWDNKLVKSIFKEKHPEWFEDDSE